MGQTTTNDKCCVDCKKVIAACDRALQAKNNALKLADLALADAKEKNALLTKENMDLQYANNRWYHNPWVVGILGVAVGTAAYTFIKR